MNPFGGLREPLQSNGAERMNLIADVIFPAFSAPYVAPMLFPVAGISAIVVGVLVFWLLNRHLDVGKIIAVVVLANLISGIFGFFLSAILPSGLVPQVVGAGANQARIIQPGPRFGNYMVLGFVVAFALSVVIEYGAVRLCAGWVRVLRPLLTVTLANLASYVTLIAIAWFWMTFVW
jgi:hypothetical protein